MLDSAVEPGEPRLLSRGFASLLVAQGAFGFAFSSFLLLPKFLGTQLGAGPGEIGVVTTLHGVTVVVCLPILGSAVDRLGRRDFLTAGAALMAVACVLFRGVEAMGPLVYALRVAQAVAFSMAFAAGGALAVDLAPRERLGHAIGLFGLTFLSMNAIASAAVEEIAARSSWQTAFGAAACAAAASALLSRLVADPPRTATDAANRTSVLDVATRPSQLRVMVVIALVGVALCAMFTFGQLFALELDPGTPVRGFFVLYAATAIALRIGFGPFVDRIGRRPVSIASLAVYAATLLGMARLAAGGFSLFGPALGVAHGVFYPAFNALAVEDLAESERGKGMALFQAAFNVGFASGGVALGALAEQAGFRPVFLVGGAGLVVALGVLVATPGARRAR